MLRYIELMENEDDEAMSFAWAEEQLRKKLHLLFAWIGGR